MTERMERKKRLTPEAWNSSKTCRNHRKCAPNHYYFIIVENKALSELENQASRSGGRERERERKNKSSKDPTWSAVPNALLGVIS